jgi:hypothetical protein
MKKTVKILNEELQLLKKQLGMPHRIEEHCVWNAEQIRDVIEESDKKNEIIKVEIVRGFEPGKKCYMVTVWRNTCLED